MCGAQCRDCEGLVPLLRPDCQVVSRNSDRSMWLLCDLFDVTVIERQDPMFQVERNDNGLVVNGAADAVIAKLRMADWGWKTNWGNTDDGAVAFEVKGSFMKDNAAAAVFEVRPISPDQTALIVEGWKGNAMSAIGGNVFNVGVKKFANKAMDKAVEILTR